jgi:exopolysaccharide biosynthesis polyprenyl glycosylphosphotransferase
VQFWGRRHGGIVKSGFASDDQNGWLDSSISQRYRTSVGPPSSERLQSDSEKKLRRFRSYLIWTDGFQLIVALGFGLLISSRASEWAINPLLAVYGTPMAILILWLALLGLRGSYDWRVIGLGPEEVRRVISATLLTFSVVAGVSYLLRADISRAYAFISLPLGLILIVASRFAWRGWLYRRRARGDFQFRTVVVGSGRGSDEIALRLQEDHYAGYQVIGRFSAPASTQEVEVWVQDLVKFLEELSADAVAVAPSESLSGESIRQLAWNIEGRSLDLLIAPALLDIGGPRLTVRPAAGLPLLHLDEATLSRSQRVSKRILDLVGSSFFIVMLSPVMLLCAIAVKFSSRGQIIFRQNRVGRAGKTFAMLKFRSMIADAEAQKANLRSEYNLEAPMFKLTHDPRITTVGKFLRRWSLDELPQLFNVLAGSMSLVGPRPHPLDDVNRYEVAAYRRLALKPGLTGLWQVEGRSDLDWGEALQLDLNYVETWSLSGDIVLLARTLRAVLQGRGAH